MGEEFGALVTIKLCLNTEHLPTLNYDNKVEGVTYHNLLECTLDIYEPRTRWLTDWNGTWSNADIIDSTSFIPSNDDYTDLGNNISIPIQYKYKYHLTEGNKIFDDDNRLRLNYEPLKGIAMEIIDMRYPELKEDLNRKRWGHIEPWKVDIAEHKYIESPVYNYKIFGILAKYVPIQDVIKYVLFDYLGYNEIDIVKIHRPISTYVPIEKCKPNEKQKELMINNDGRLPFKIEKKRDFLQLKRSIMGQKNVQKLDLSEKEEIITLVEIKKIIIINGKKRKYIINTQNHIIIVIIKKMQINRKKKESQKELKNYIQKNI